MNRYLVLALIVVLAVPMIGCTTPPPDDGLPPPDYHFKASWRSNSSHQVSISSLNLSNESIANLVFVKVGIKLRIGDEAKAGDASVIIDDGRFILDFELARSFGSPGSKGFENDVRYDIRLDMELISQDPAVSGLVLFGDDNTIYGEIMLHDNDMELFEANITDPAGYEFQRTDSDGHLGRVSLDLGPGHFLEFELDVSVYD